MSLQVSGALLTDVGRQRTVNEDWCGSFVPDEQDAGTDGLSVWVIADVYESELPFVRDGQEATGGPIRQCIVVLHTILLSIQL